MCLQRAKSDGLALISVLFLVVVLLGLTAAYYKMTSIELATTKSTSNSAAGFFSAEAALNLRAAEVEITFKGYNRPEGTSPSGSDPCMSGNDGSDDFICKSMAFANHTAISYVIENPNNPVVTQVAEGELYQGLNSQQYQYTVRAMAKNLQNRIEAILDLRFKSMLIPMFQFVAFYDKDLEILPGPTMNLSGPVHTNGDLYLNAGNQLRIDGQTSMAGRFFRGRKNNSTCKSKPVQIRDPGTYQSVEPSCPNRTEIFEADVVGWNGMIQIGVDSVTVPEPELLEPTPGNVYFDKADLRLVLSLDGANNPDLSSSATGVEIRNDSYGMDGDHINRTVNLDACVGSVDGRVVNYTKTFYNNREAADIHMLELDLQGLFDCIYSVNNALLFAKPEETIMGGKQLDDDTEGGLVIHLSVDGPDSTDLPNEYGVRIRNGETVQSSLGGAPLVKGLTIVTEQAIYVAGHYNRIGKIPAAFLADAFNVLSRNWNLDDSKSTQGLSNRVASNTTINAAVLAGTDTTGGTEGVGGQGGGYNGGLENYPRFHEKWSGKTLTYRGSFVSLNTSLHSDGAWVYGGAYYKAPNRDWDYDTDFNDAANLPPLSPRFVYLRQELFEREFEQD